MSRARRKIYLLLCLRKLGALLARGLTVTENAEGYVVISKNGHVRGVWLVTERDFQYTPGGYNEPAFYCGKISEALDHALRVFESASSPHMNNVMERDDGHTSARNFFKEIDASLVGEALRPPIDRRLLN